MTNQLSADTLVQSIREVARRATSEEDVRFGVEHALSNTLESLGLRRQAEYEKTTFSGSADAVYGHVIIEYKRPGRLAETGFPAKLSEQIGRYLVDFTRSAGGWEKQSKALEKMIGIGIDGQQIMFLRYSASGRRRDLPVAPLPGTPSSFYEIADFGSEGKGGFVATGPVQITKESIGLLLLYLRSLSRKPLTPEGLASKFGPQSEVARQTVNALFQALQANRAQPRVATFFAEWQRIFGIVYGEEMGDAEKDAPELAALYGAVGGKSTPLQPLFFAVHTYYALLMKFLAIELASLQEGALVGSFAAILPSMPDRDLRRALTELENGGTFALLGINNFLEGDFFGWYLDAWDEALGNAIRSMSRELSDFEPATSTLEPEHTRDLLKKLYQYLVPKKLRHDLGEYYTPDWLAERLLNQVGYHGETDKRLVDPGCGSGTFPILALKRLRQYAADHLVEPAQILEAALHNIAAFDLNPLSVIAARTNFLLALGDLLRYRRGNIDIPVYLCDSILTPSEYGDMFGKVYRLHTVVGNFELPGELISTGEIAALAKLVEDCIKNDYSLEDFMARARRELSVTQPNTDTYLEALYRRFYELEKEGRNGIWARLIKNAFAPVLVGKFDFVVGNPPWVNWESLSQEYRDATKKLWEDYGLFTLSGHAARLGGGKKDLSMLFTYVAADKYLKPKGKLGFVITQTVFKTKGAGDGFRRFRIGDKEPVNVLAVDDMVELQPFEGASNWTAVFVIQKGVPIKYPVSYLVWHIIKGQHVRLEDSLEEVIAKTERDSLKAQPVDSKSLTSPWMTARSRALDALQKVIGQAAYEAHAGSSTWANGVYWIQILNKRPDGLLVVRNLNDVGRLEITSEQAVIEPDLVYPLLRGREIKRWYSAPEAYILLVQDSETRTGYTENWMRVNQPNLYSYLKKFEELLRSRSGYKRYFDTKKDAFYSIYNVSSFTLAQNKVVWKALTTDVAATVISVHDDKWFTQAKPVIPEHNTIFISTESEVEAHYLCSILNSNISNLVVRSHSSLFYSASILEFLAIPHYNPSNALHLRLSALSQQAHALAQTSEFSKNSEVLAAIEAEIDLAAAELWGISAKELAEIRKSLEEL